MFASSHNASGEQIISLISVATSFSDSSMIPFSIMPALLSEYSYDSPVTGVLLDVEGTKEHSSISSGISLPLGGDCSEKDQTWGKLMHFTTIVQIIGCKTDIIS